MSVFKPAESKGFAWGLGLMVFCGVILLLPVVMSAGSGAGLGFTLTMGLLFIFIVIVTGYFTWAAKNLTYEVKGKELVISWAFHDKHIPLDQIQGFQKVIGTSSMKVVGASWPGFHWGSFSSPTGKGSVNLYATRLWGEIILLKTKWETIGVTPQDANGFLEALKKQNPDLAEGLLGLQPEEGGRFAPFKDKIFLGMLAITFLITVGTAIFLALKIPQLSGQIPMHYNFQGQVDRYGAPGEIWVPFGIGALTNVLIIGFTMAVARNNKMSAYMIGSVSIFIALIFSAISIGMVVSGLS